MKRLLLIPALWLALAAPAGAQCVMCYRTAHAQNEARSRVLDWGILVLGAPPFLILASFVAFVFKKNEICGGTDEEAAVDWCEPDPVEPEKQGLSRR